MSEQGGALTAQVEAKKILAKRLLARRRLIHFVKATFPGYQAGWVHEDICRRLERFSKQVAERKSPRLMIMQPPRSGKSVENHLRLPTPSGWKTHGELQVGDKVYHPSGRVVTVVAVSEEHMADCEVTFTDHTKFVVHENHEWTVYNRPRRRWETRETKSMIYQGPGKRDRALYQLPLVECFEGKERNLPLDPYTLGIWLGDGKSDGASICGSAEDMAHIVPRLKCELGATWTQQNTGVVYQYMKGILSALRELEVYGLGNKHIPAVYLRASEAQRRALLAGLVDSDGYVEKETCRAVVSGVNERLIRGVAELVRSLGYRATLTRAEPRERNRVIQDKQVLWTVQWTPHDGIPQGTLPRKALTRVRDRRRIGIMDIRRVEPRPAKCIQVDSPDGLYVVSESWIATHNSELASIRFPAWHLGQYPHHEFINVGYNTDLPMKFSRKIREMFRTGEYQAIMPNARLDPDSQSVEAWNTTEGGGFTTAGVGGGITGKGAHILTIDDPIKNQEEADSAQVRDKLWDWYQSTAYTRLAPGGGVLVIQTCWSDDDLAGRLQAAMRNDPEADQFEIIKYPALSEQWEYRDDSNPDEIGPIIRSDEELDLNLEENQGLTLLRPKDWCLHEERYDNAALKRIRANLQPRIWSALYQQNPVPDEGLYFKQEYFRYQRVFPEMKHCRVFTAWDFAVTTKQMSDYTVGATMMQDYEDQLYVLEIHRIKAESLDIVEAMLDTARKWGSDPAVGYMIGVENGQIWLSMEPFFKKRMNERRQYVVYEALKPLTDKMARARPLQGRMQQGRVIFPESAPWLSATEQELLRFPAGVHDDIVDALAWAAQLVLNKEPPRKPDEKKMPSWRDRLNAALSIGSHMSA